MNDDHGVNVALHGGSLHLSAGGYLGAMKPIKLEQYWTPPEVAEALSKDPSTIRRMIAAGDIPAVDLGVGRTSYRVADSELMAYLEARRTIAPKV